MNTRHKPYLSLIFCGVWRTAREEAAPCHVLVWCDQELSHHEGAWKVQGVEVAGEGSSCGHRVHGDGSSVHCVMKSDDGHSEMTCVFLTFLHQESRIIAKIDQYGVGCCRVEREGGELGMKIAAD